MILYTKLHISNKTINNLFTRKLYLVFLSKTTDAVDCGIDALKITNITLKSNIHHFYFLDFLLSCKLYIIFLTHGDTGTEKKSSSNCSTS